MSPLNTSERRGTGGATRAAGVRRRSGVAAGAGGRGGVACWAHHFVDFGGSTCPVEVGWKFLEFLNWQRADGHHRRASGPRPPPPRPRRRRRRTRGKMTTATTPVVPLAVSQLSMSSFGRLAAPKASLLPQSPGVPHWSCAGAAPAGERCGRQGSAGALGLASWRRRGGAAYELAEVGDEVHVPGTRPEVLVVVGVGHVRRYRSRERCLVGELWLRVFPGCLAACVAAAREAEDEEEPETSGRTARCASTDHRRHLPISAVRSSGRAARAVQARLDPEFSGRSIATEGTSPRRGFRSTRARPWRGRSPRTSSRRSDGAPRPSASSA